MKGQIERVRAPRALFAEFPLGRPLGRPGDADLQTAVLRAAFALLDASEVPVLETFPEKIEDAAEDPVACPLPARLDPSLPAAVDEATGLRAAYDRTVDRNGGRTLVGRAVDAGAIPDAIASFVRVAEGTPWKEAGIPGHPGEVAMDVRAYYEEAALALSEHVPEARATETWFYKHTEAGKALLAARDKIREQDGPWSRIAPATQ